MTITCCQNCKSPIFQEGINETQPLIAQSNNESLDTGFDENTLDNKNEVYTAKQTLIGMVVVALGTSLFCTVGAIVQQHGGSVLQLMLGRYVTQNIISWIIWFTDPFKIKTDCNHWYGDSKRVNIWIRGFLLFCTVFFWWRGLELVPLGEAEAIYFLAPITTVIVARILLKEPLPKTFFVTVVITIVGLVFICQPTFIFDTSSSEYMALSWEGILFLIGAVFTWTATCVLVRTAKTAHWLQLEITATTQSILIWCPLIILLNKFWLHSNELSGGDWQFDMNTFIVMIVIGVLGFLALMLNVIGYQIGNATKVAWMEYLDLVFAFLYQWLYFKDTPTNWEIIGCCLLLSTCIIHIIEEYYHYNQVKIIEKNRNQVMEGNYTI